MGHNAEFVQLLIDLRKEGHLYGRRSVAELGAQEVSAAPEVVSTLLERGGLDSGNALLARDLYARFALDRYLSIDTSGQLGSVALDLNRDLRSQGLFDTFDIVTNAGTAEHCFDQAALFRNMHDLCVLGGLMIHVLPSQGLANHGFFNYHPRFVWELSHANSYEIIKLGFTIDFRPRMFPYSADSFREHQDRDVMLYAVLKKTRNEAFSVPMDRIFDHSKLVADSEFRSWIKTTWEHVRGFDLLDPDAQA
jgi:SAM-dependent methyltransferase